MSEVSIIKNEGHLPHWLVIMTAGTGGPQALGQILQQLPANFPAAVIVMPQIRPGFTKVLTEQYSHVCSLPVHELVDGEAIQSGRILIAPSNQRLKIENLGDETTPAYTALLDEFNDPDGYRTRVDEAMISAAQTFGRYTIGVLLTGLGCDGREGMRAITTAGGITIIQNEATSVVFDLPQSALNANLAQEILPLWSIADRIIQIVGGEAHEAAA